MARGSIVAAVTLLAAAVMTACAQPEPSRAPVAHTAPISHPAPPMSTPPGYHRIAYHDITIAVPVGVPVLTVPCTLPTAYVLAADPERAYACPAQPAEPRPTRLAVLLGDDAPAPPHGLSRRIGDVVITVTAPTPAQEQSILRSARPGPDPLGCPQNRPRSAADTTGRAQPVGALSCLYAAAGWLLGSHELPRPDRVAARVAALRDDKPEQADLVRFTYPDGSTRDVAVQQGYFALG